LIRLGAKFWVAPESRRWGAVLTQHKDSAPNNSARIAHCISNGGVMAGSNQIGASKAVGEGMTGELQASDS
jgi:hypothetical protein